MKVFDKNGQLLCDIDESKEIARGGEGRVIDMDSNHVAKLYLSNVKPIEEKKFYELYQLDSPMFIKPESLLYDFNKNIIGFSMRKVPKEFFPLVSLLNKVFCNRESITLSTKKEVIANLINGVQYAHQKQVIIGDLNPYNILVNKQGVVYFIDTDSFETPGFKHSGVLLEDVRDFLYNGDVNINADYFSLSVLIFNILTYVHPFKGIHKKYPKISERMIHKQSVLVPSPDLIVPKCYDPLTNSELLDQFSRIFNNGERFIIKLQPSTGLPVAAPKQAAPMVVKSELLNVKLFYQDSGNKIVTTAASKHMLVIHTANGEYSIYDTTLKGTLSLVKKDMTNAKNLKLFVYDRNVYALNNGALLQIYPEMIPIVDFERGFKVKADLYGSNLVVVTDNIMFNYDLRKSSVGLSYTATSIYGPGFSQIDSIYQNVSGKTVFMYSEKDSVNYALSNIAIKNVIQRHNLLLIEEIINEQVKYHFLKLNNLKVSNIAQVNGLRYFDLINENVVVIPEDNVLILARTVDMATILEFDCPVISTDSIIHATDAGIIIVNEDSCYLANNK